MKKVIIFSFLLVFSIAPFIIFGSNPPKANFGIYGIQHFKTLLEYKEYIGKTVVYLPKELSTSEDKKIFKGEFMKEYIITKITGDDLRMIFLLQEKEGKNKMKMVIYNEEKNSVYGKSKFCITESYSVPLFLIDKFENDKSNYIGKKYTSNKVISEYECMDIVMKSKKESYSFLDEPYPTLHYILKNSINGKKIAYPAENVETHCFAEDISGKYISTLFKVEKPVDESVRYGETKTVELEGVTKYSYIDDFIDILILGDSKSFSFLLKNISQNSIKLVWNEAVFVDFTGSTSKIMHLGTKYSQKESDQPSSTIIKGAHIEDVAVPTSNIRYSDILKEWVTDSMYPRAPATSPGEIRLMLPVQVKDIINEYIFVFKVDWVYNHPELLKE